MKATRLRALLALLFFLWMGFLVAFFYITQKPLALQVLPGLAATLWALGLTLLMVLNAASLGSGLLGFLWPDSESTSAFLIGVGLGLGAIGLLGFALAVVGLAQGLSLLLIQLAALGFFAWNGWLRRAAKGFADVWSGLHLSVPAGLRWIPVVAVLTLGFSFLLAFAPPVEGFDGLLYHLTVPSLWLRDGGLRAYNIPHYWFPQLVEGIFIWALGLGSEQATQLLHLVFGVLTVVLLWNWARENWRERVAWWTVALLLSMPSLPWLAAWAYTDLALAFYTLAVLYLLWKTTPDSPVLQSVLTGLLAGLAMGIKYTSFVVPVFGMFFLFWIFRRQPGRSWRMLLAFGFSAMLVAAPWYVRNWAWMGNPFYPFVFGGRYWDAFRARWYADLGTGIGFDPLALLSLPLTVTLGYRDANYFDGRIGPLWLVLFPLTVWALWRARTAPALQRRGLWLLGSFTLVSLLFWVVGVMNSSALWQSRLLFPALIPFAIPTALGVLQLSALDSRALRISFIAQVIIAVLLFATLLDFSLSVVARNPLAVSLGITQRFAYIEHYQSGYADLLSLTAQTPADASIYFLFEPRSYGVNRQVQPDAINDNFAHDLYLYHNADAILNAWRAQGYTHVLVSQRGLDFVAADLRKSGLFDLDLTREWKQVAARLKWVASSSDGAYDLYALPPAH